MATGNTIDLWKTFADFFRGDPMYVMMSIITIIGFGLTVYVYLKIRKVNNDLKKGKRVSNYLAEYSEILKIVNGKGQNKPSDLYDRTTRINTQLLCHFGFYRKHQVKKLFEVVDKDDTSYQMLRNFLQDVIILFERNAI